jgi:PBP1b-binding outer membrane lipoprotein LpoB
MKMTLMSIAVVLTAMFAGCASKPAPEPKKSTNEIMDEINEQTDSTEEFLQK